MIYIPVAAQFTAVLRVPDSASGDTVSYQILKVSDGSVFASGTPSWVGSNLWAVNFTPTAADETYALTITDTTLDTTVSESYKATATSNVATAQTIATTDAELLTQVNTAISSFLNGGAVVAYNIGGRYVMSSNLKELYEIRDKLIARVNAGQKNRTYARFGNPS